MRSYIVKENHMGSVAVSDILRYKQTYSQITYYLYIKIDCLAILVARVFKKQHFKLRQFSCPMIIYISAYL